MEDHDSIFLGNIDKRWKKDDVSLFDLEFHLQCNKKYLYLIAFLTGIAASFSTVSDTSIDMSWLLNICKIKGK